MTERKRLITNLYKLAQNVELLTRYARCGEPEKNLHSTEKEQPPVEFEETNDYILADLLENVVEYVRGDVKESIYHLRSEVCFAFAEFF